MTIFPTSLCFLTTRKCTASCRNCCFGCSPNNNEFIPIEHMHRLIDEAKDVKSIKTIVFSGGECFLLGNELNSLIKHASNNGFITRFVSNGYWATSEEIALKKISKLASVGLKEANFSTGDDHMEFVPLKNIHNGAIACAKHDIPTYIMMELKKNSKFPVDEFYENKEFKDFIEQEKIITRPSVWMSFDEEQKIEYPSSLSSKLRVDGCTSLMRDIAISSNGDILLCCGLAQDYLSGFAIGNIFKNNKLADVFQCVKSDFIKIWLNVCGPRQILDYVKKYMPNLSHLPPTLHRCEYCKIIYTNKSIQKVIMDNLPQDMDLIIKHFYERHFIETVGHHFFPAMCNVPKANKTNIPEIIDYFKK